MSLEKLVENLGEQTDRRRFLKRAGASALIVAGGIMGFPREARATLWSCAGLLPPCSGGLHQYQCCCLIYEPTPWPQCSCQDVWCWGCCGNCQTGEKWACCECTGCSYAYIYDYSCQKCQGPS